MTENKLLKREISGDISGVSVIRQYYMRGSVMREFSVSMSDNIHGYNVDVRVVGDAILSQLFPLACPSDGAFVGWKKCRDDLIVKLQITEDSKRSSAFCRQCRCSKAVVLEIQNLDGTKSNADYAVSIRDGKFKYRVGETVEVDDFDDDRMHECSTGIHFFITRKEAVTYEIF